MKPAYASCPVCQGTNQMESASYKAEREQWIVELKCQGLCQDGALEIAWGKYPLRLIPCPHCQPEV